jgi:ankyrin repeat protein
VFFFFFFPRCSLSLPHFFRPRRCEQGRLIDAGDDTGATPLHLACFHGHAECAAELIRYGAAINLTDKAGTLALFTAAEGGHETLAVDLLEMGAAARVRQTRGEERPWNRWCGSVLVHI